MSIISESTNFVPFDVCFLISTKNLSIFSESNWCVLLYSAGSSLPSLKTSKNLESSICANKVNGRVSSTPFNLFLIWYARIAAPFATAVVGVKYVSDKCVVWSFLDTFSENNFFNSSLTQSAQHVPPINKQWSTFSFVKFAFFIVFSINSTIRSNNFSFLISSSNFSFVINIFTSEGTSLIKSCIWNTILSFIFDNKSLFIDSTLLLNSLIFRCFFSISSSLSFLWSILKNLSILTSFFFFCFIRVVVLFTIILLNTSSKFKPPKFESPPLLTTFMILSIGSPLSKFSFISQQQISNVPPPKSTTTTFSPTWYSSGYSLWYARIEAVGSCINSMFSFRIPATSQALTNAVFWLSSKSTGTVTHTTLCFKSFIPFCSFNNSNILWIISAVTSSALNVSFVSYTSPNLTFIPDMFLRSETTSNVNFNPFKPFFKSSIFTPRNFLELCKIPEMFVFPFAFNP